MIAPGLPPAVECLRRAARPPADVPDADLLARFARDRDEAAFAALVRRHGPLVLGVCRRVLGHHDAEDACQTTFLILARKAAGLIGRGSVAGWLAGVARNVARKARRAAARRTARETRAASAPRPDPAPAGLADVVAALDAEVARLPAAEREAFTVCVLEGLSKARAARRLGWTEGTVSGRLARARERLRARLARRGITLSAALTAVSLAGTADALTPALVAAVVRRACTPAAHSAVAVLVRSVGAVILTGAVLTAGAAGWLGQPGDWAGQPKPPADPPVAKGPAVSPRVDLAGDRLPNRVLARLGHQRFRHEEMVKAVAVSPDGKTVASATWAGVVRLWEAETGKLRREWDAKTLAGPPNLQFLGRGDRLFVGTVGERLPPHIVETATGEVVWKQTPDPDRRRNGWGSDGVHLSADGTVLLEAWAGGSVQTVDRATGKVRFDKRLVEAGGGRAIRSPRLVPDGTAFLVVPGAETGVWECSTATGAIVRKYDVGISFVGVSVSADGRYVAAYRMGALLSPDGTDTVVVWDRKKNEKVCTVERAFPDPHCLEFSPDGKTFAVGSRGSDAVLLNTADGADVRRFPVGTYCLCLAFSPDGRTLVTGDNWGLVARWDVATGKRLAPVEADVPDSLVRAEFAAGGRELVTYGDRLAWWDPTTGKSLRVLAGSFGGISPNPYHSSRLSPDGRTLAFYRHDEKAERKHAIWVRDVATGVERALFDRLDGWPGDVRYSPDGKRLVVAGRFRAPVVYVLDAESGRVVHTLTDHKKYVEHAKFSPDGRRLVSYGTDGNANGDHEIRVWDIERGKLVHKLPPVRGAAFDAAFSPDGRTLVSAGGDPGRNNTKGEVHVWDLEMGKLLRVWDGHTERVTAVAVSPDGRSILTGGIDRRVRLWDLATGSLRHEFAGHRAYPTSVAFAPDGRRFVACSADAPGYVWDVYGHLTGQSAPLSAGDAKAIWKDLAEGDAAVGFRAVGRLAAGGDGAVAHLRGWLQPVPAADAAQVERWLADLGADRFAVREQAAAELGKVADQVRPRLRRVLESDVPAEVRDRVTKLLAAADADGPEARRARRACEALEVIGTADARRLAAELAAGAPGARLTEEARGTVERLAGSASGRPHFDPKPARK